MSLCIHLGDRFNGLEAYVINPNILISIYHTINPNGDSKNFFSRVVIKKLKIIENLIKRELEYESNKARENLK